MTTIVDDSMRMRSQVGSNNHAIGALKTNSYIYTELEIVISHVSESNNPEANISS